MDSPVVSSPFVRACVRVPCLLLQSPEEEEEEDDDDDSGGGGPGCTPNNWCGSGCSLSTSSGSPVRNTTYLWECRFVDTPTFELASRYTRVVRCLCTASNSSVVVCLSSTSRCFFFWGC